MRALRGASIALLLINQHIFTVLNCNKDMKLKIVTF